MGRGHDDGVYVSDRRVQRRKKAAVAVAGMAAILAGGGYAVSAWHTARDTTIVAEPPYAPLPTSPSPSPSSESPAPETSGPRLLPSPDPRTPSPRLSGARHSSRPSPTPSPPPLADDDLVAAQVNQLLRAPRATPSPGGLTAAGQSDGITVTNKSGPDGSAIRVLSARYDLTSDGRLLWAADRGHPIGGARCTQNLRVERAEQVRPTVLLCWRATEARSVVTVATTETGRPAATASAAILDQTWHTLG